MTCQYFLLGLVASSFAFFCASMQLSGGASEALKWGLSILSPPPTCMQMLSILVAAVGAQHSLTIRPTLCVCVLDDEHSSLFIYFAEQ